MWRNISWNSTDSTLPEGMHRHETGPYFKTPSMQSGGSSQSAAGSQGPPVILCANEAAQQQPQQQQQQQQQQQPDEAAGQTIKRGSFETTSHQSQVSGSSMVELAGSAGIRSPRHSESISEPEVSPGQRQQHVTRRARFKETPRQMSSSAGQQQRQTSQQGGGAPGHHHGFRSRLSSISGALQHPKLARRFFSGHSETSDQQQQASTVQITTTSIDSPQHGGRAEPGQTAAPNCYPQSEPPAEPRPLTSSSGRRLSQLFLPQMGQNPILNQMQDPYASNELIPPHLLGLFGQPPLVGGVGQSSPGGHRSSWADTSLFGRLSNVRPSLDSGYQGTGQMRHSFDARK
jgi:hypothetical protein